MRHPIAPRQHSDCLEIWEELSGDAREIINLLLETPQELLEEVPTPKRLLGRVKRYLIAKGRKANAIHLAHLEIQGKFREVWST
jgi:hypothetical protein